MIQFKKLNFPPEKIFLTSDLHLNHKNLCRGVSSWSDTSNTRDFESLEEMNNTIISAINEYVKEDCLLINCGDILFGNKKLLSSFLDRLLCKSIIHIQGNHCVSENTEILTNNGWKKGKEITKQDLIGQLNIESKLEYYNWSVKHQGYSDSFISISNKHTQQTVIPRHQVIHNNSKSYAYELLQQDLKNKDLILAPKINCTPYDIKDEDLMVLTWLVCDGTIVHKYNKTLDKYLVARLQWKLSKPEKLDKLKNILDYYNIKYTFRKAKKSGINKLQPYYICIYTNEARKFSKFLPVSEGKSVKKFPDFFKLLSLNQSSIVANSLLDTDASMYGKTLILTSIDKGNLDTLQLMFFNVEKVSRVIPVKKGSGFINGKKQYTLYVYFSNSHIKNKPIKVAEIIGEAPYVGFSTEKGNMVIREEGKITITGNCHFISTFAHPFLECKQLGYYKVEDTIFMASHYPMELYHSSHKGCLLAFGHTHASHITRGRQLDVGIDNAFKMFGQYRPFTFKEFKDYCESKPIFIDSHHNHKTN